MDVPLMAKNIIRSPRNRTISLTDKERTLYEERLCQIKEKMILSDLVGKTINQDLFEILPFLPDDSVDLLIVDPPYNKSKSFDKQQFKKMPEAGYEEWLNMWLSGLIHTLKARASIYICGDWQSSTSIYNVARCYFKVRNRITWEREKGRGARSNWKNCSEDIWFCTMSDDYTFNVDSVKLRRRVLAPYRNESGCPKDWEHTEEGRFRMTYPSNLWTDISVPFWSMPENTDHPTQKPEKLVAKLILASSNEGDVVFDPFLGSGTTSVVAKKLNREYFGAELQKEYCLIAEKRLAMANEDKHIQGYSDGCFLERNALQK